MEISLSDLLKSLKKCWIVMLAYAIIAGLGAFFYTNTQIRKEYSSSVNFMLSPTDELDSITSVSQSIATGNAMVPQMMNKIRSESVMKMILDYSKANGSLSYDYNPLSLTKKVSVAYDDASGNSSYRLCIKVTIRAYSPQDCQTLLESLSACINNDEIMDTYKGQFAFKPYTTIHPGVKVAPSVLTNTAIFAFLGMILPYGVVFVLDLMDRRIHNEEDLKRIAGKYPIIGLIPTMD